ncbi:MAG: AAA family ATPase [Candidatus Tectomicrobia bacterium]|uniref:AAA family ATPase n=1 Tax=Tectimicrobiota bacterium TaxID=2528274 RepID=A0A933GKT9_UNCTE|nr:AAA family ATPase [Candidatus Tectomicrobia bacterium]
MKILELQLLAFGPFSDLRFDFTEGHQGLHILFGHNEAGKSSALRAISALLYGIPHNSPDNFKHENNKLRIGGHLRHSDGCELMLLRRKGNKNTILGPDEKPLNDAVLDKFLQGIDQRLFTNVFGIDHETLVSGGQDILRGGGEVGQSLFAAALGGSSLRSVLQGLDDEANALFLPRGQNQEINRAIAEYKKAKQEVHEAALPSREWSETDENLKKALRESDTLSKELRRIGSENTRLERLQSALPKVSQRRNLMEKLDNLGEVVVLPPEFTQNRHDCIQKLKSAQENKKRAEENLKKLNEEITGLVVPEQIINQTETITDIHQRLGSHLKAAQDRHKLQGNFQQLKADSNLLLAELQLNLEEQQIRTFRPPIALRTRIQEIGGHFQTLTHDLDRAKKDCQNTESELTRGLKALDELESARDPDKLKRSLSRIRKQGDLTAEQEETLRKLRIEEEQAQVSLKKLGLWSGSMEELERLPLPAPETIDRFESLFQSLMDQQKGLEGKIQDTSKEIKELSQKIEELRLSGAIPTEDELTEARGRRDQGWSLVRRAWLDEEDIRKEEKNYDSESPLPEAFEKSVRQTDELSDRLRREANRVAENASLIARKTKLIDDHGRLEKDKAETWSQMRQEQKAWVGLWETLRIGPLPPREMRSWMVKYGKLIEKAERVHDYRRKAQENSQQIEKNRLELSGHLEELRENSSGAGETLDTLCDRCQAVIDSIEETNRSRKDLQTRTTKLQNDLDDFKQTLKDSVIKLEKWQKDWKEAMTRLGLSENTLPAEANAYLAKVEQFFNKLDEIDRLEQRIQGIERDAVDFAGDVTTLVRIVEPELLGTPAEQAAAHLHTQLSKAMVASARTVELKKQIREKEELLRESEYIISDKKDQLDSLCRQAGCSDFNRLEEIEERSSTYQTLQEEMANLEEQLLVLAGGNSLQQLLEEAGQVDADSLPSQISELTLKVEELEKDRSQVDQKIGGLRKELQSMGGSSKAAEAAERVQDHLAAIRSAVDRYLRLRISSHILKREIENYRAKNQGQLLGRASELFSALTLGSLVGLHTDFNDKDEPVLLGVRPSGERVGVAGMSDGTRDQLYLSLRLATLERYLETNEPVPFIVDDILIKFDDERALATMKVLADLSSKTQVIFFTHHSRLVDLANHLNCDGQVYIHRFS